MLLTNEEIQEIIKEGVLKYSSLDVPFRRQAIDRDIAKRQDELTEQDTLKKVGKWLLINKDARTVMVSFTDKELYALLRGEWPK